VKCSLCERAMYPDDTGEPYLEFKDKRIYSDCYINLLPEIYNMAGFGDGGMIHLVFQMCLTSIHNRKKRPTVRNYNSVLKTLLHKYNFACVQCGSEKELSIDHIKPKSKGGSDEESNLQILCKSCNSSKGNKWNEPEKEQNLQ
jgi:hypothetical protein